MVHNIQIAGKNLFPIDHEMNINQFRRLSKTTLCFTIQRRATFYFYFKRNYASIKKSSIQSFVSCYNFLRLFFKVKHGLIRGDFGGHRIANGECVHVSTFSMLYTYMISRMFLFRNFDYSKL